MITDPAALDLLVKSEHCLRIARPPLPKQPVQYAVQTGGAGSELFRERTQTRPAFLPFSPSPPGLFVLCQRARRRAGRSWSHICCRTSACNGLAPVVSSTRMRLLKIQEFALSTAVEYRRPVILGEAKLDAVAKSLASPPCGNFLNAADISLIKQSELFSYTLSVPLFSGAANIIINAQGITISFKQGRTNEHLDLMIKLTLAALGTAKVEEVKRSLLSFTAHAVFDPPSDYAEHMKRFTGLAANVVSGGLVVVTQIPDVEGELRYASEKSLAYTDALFFAANSVCQRDVTADLFKTMGERFEAAAALEDIGFKKPEGMRS